MLSLVDLRTDAEGDAGWRRGSQQASCPALLQVEDRSEGSPREPPVDPLLQPSLQHHPEGILTNRGCEGSTGPLH